MTLILNRKNAGTVEYGDIIPGYGTVRYIESFLTNDGLHYQFTCQESQDNRIVTARTAPLPAFASVATMLVRQERYGYDDYDKLSTENLPPDESWQEFADHQLDHDPTPGQLARKASTS